MKPPWEAVGLNREEKEAAARLLGREPNALEWGLFGALWSEHCSYKSSKGVLGWMPKAGRAVVSGPGGNAGVVRLNDRVEVAFKVESHNHPSFVEPVQGAETGVGGIIRDVVAMGARPVALMDSLRFGTDEHAALLRHRVVEGVGRYGNAIGVPTVGGEVFYAPGYAKNPLVNVVCVGVRDAGTAIDAAGCRPGDVLYLIGQATGRDGIHGASLLASRDFSAGDEDLRPTVQVGDPFTGKLLLEATLDAARTGAVTAVQDLGAAGLASATSELAVRSGVGLLLYLDRVPTREPHLTPYDLMMSETQERMLLALDPGRAEEALAVVRRWGLAPHLLGEATADGMLRLRYRSELVAEVPAAALVDGCPVRPAPARVRPEPPAIPRRVEAWPDADVIRGVLAHPDVASRRAIYERYDAMIQTQTVWGPEHEAAVLDLHQGGGLALAVAGPGRWCAVDAYAGGAGAVCAAVGRLAATGALTLGLTDGLNAGNPDKAPVYAAFSAMVAGIADAAEALAVPVTGGNVSFHNETDGVAIWPTAVIGAVGRHPDPRAPVADTIPGAGFDLWLMNPEPHPAIGASVFEAVTGRPVSAYPRPRLTMMAEAVRLVSSLAEGADASRMAIRYIAVGGLFTALVRMTLGAAEGLGLTVSLPPGAGPGDLFGEEAGRFVLASERGLAPWIERQAAAHGIRIVPIGESEASDGIQIRVDQRTLAWSRRALSEAWAGSEREDADGL